MSVAGKTFSAFPTHAPHAILRIWQEAHAISRNSDDCKWDMHYSDVIMSTLASQINGHRSRRYQSFASLSFLMGIRRSPVDSPHRGPVTRKILFMIRYYLYGPDDEILLTPLPVLLFVSMGPFCLRDLTLIPA